MVIATCSPSCYAVMSTIGRRGFMFADLANVCHNNLVNILIVLHVLVISVHNLLMCADWWWLINLLWTY